MKAVVPSLLLCVFASMQGATYEVTCASAPPISGSYPTISAALAAAQTVAPRDHVIRVYGNCAEQVNITDWTNLQIIGQGEATLTYPATPTNQPVLAVWTSNRVTVANLDISGRATPSVDLVRFSYSQQFVLRNVRISASGGAGLQIQANSVGFVAGCTIEDNHDAGMVVLGSMAVVTDSGSPTVVRRSGAAGIAVSHEAHLQLAGSPAIEGNAGSGIELKASSALIYGQSGNIRVAGNRDGLVLSSGSRVYSSGSLTVENNSRDGVSLSASSIDLDGTGGTLAIRSNGGNGITAGSNSYAKVLSGSIGTNQGKGVLAIDNSTTSLQGATIAGNHDVGVSAQSLSVAVIEAGNTIQSNSRFDLFCEVNSHGRGTKSGVGRVLCPGFDETR